MKKNILNELGKRIVFFDGGMGTLLQERGLEAGELPENWKLKHPDNYKRIAPRLSKCWSRHHFGKHIWCE